MIKLFDLAKETKAFGKFELGRVISNPYARAFAPQVNEAEESEDHEVSMAQNQLDAIIKAATELKSKMGTEEKQIPAWIQDHITNSENYITQAASNYHEYGDSNENVNEGKKVFKVNPGIGKAKYSISSHDGVKKHKDGSDFWDIEIFKNKVDLEKAIKNYSSKGFVKESSIKEASPCWKGYKQVGMKEKNGKEVPNCVPISENLLKEVRSVKVIQKDIDKVLANIQTALSQYKAHKGSADEKKHIDNLKKLTKLRKDLEDEMEVSVSQLYKDAEFDV